jgi:hypothetical protein
VRCSCRLTSSDCFADNQGLVPAIGPTEVLLLLVLFPIPVGIPAYVVCSRRNVSLPGLAFIPFVGPWIAMLRSIGTSAWATLLVLVPVASLGLAVWMAFTVPSRHGRSTLWGIWLIVPLANIVGFWVYAFTLPSPQLQPLAA